MTRKLFSNNDCCFYVVERPPKKEDGLRAKFFNELLEAEGFLTFKNKGRGTIGEVFRDKKKKAYLFVHTSDFLKESKSHFSVKKNNCFKVFFEEVFDDLSKYKPLENNVVILWFKHEPLSCSVYGPLYMAEQKSKNNDNPENRDKEFAKDLMEIVYLHDSVRRTEKRKALFSILAKEQELNENDRELIKECEKWNI